MNQPDESCQFVDDATGRTCQAYRDGHRVAWGFVDGELVYDKVFQTLEAARAEYANFRCDPAANAPQPGDVVHIGRDLRIAVTSVYVIGHDEWVINGHVTGGQEQGEPATRRAHRDEFWYVSRPASP